MDAKSPGLLIVQETVCVDRHLRADIMMSTAIGERRVEDQILLWGGRSVFNFSENRNRNRYFLVSIAGGLRIL